MSFLCNHCNKSYSNKGNLITHQTTSKTCLKIQNKEVAGYACEYCKYITGRKEYLVKHDNTCKYKKAQDILYKQCLIIKHPNINPSGNMFMRKLKLPTGDFIDIPIRSDGYMNATLMCKSHNKLFKHWENNKETQEFIAINKGVIRNLQGSWIHPDLAIQLAQWLSPMFAIQVSEELDRYKEVSNVNIENGNSVIEAVEEKVFACKLKLPSGELIDIPIRSDGYMNATLMCKAYNKRFNNWNQLKETQDCIEAIKSITGIPVIDLIASIAGNNGGSWIHPDLAIQLAQWLSPMFAIQVSKELDRYKQQVSQINNIENGNSTIEAVDKMFTCQLKLSNEKIIDVPIRSDGYINATISCKAYNKRVDNWMRLEQTQKMITAIENDTSHVREHLIQTVTTGNKKLHGTYIHPDLQVTFCMWVSVDFAIQVSRWTRELLLTGKVELGKEKTPLELDEKLEDLLTNKIRFDLDPYTEKDVIYFYHVVPKLEYAVENKEERDFYEFGVTSDIVKRDIAYTNDKHYKKVKLKNVIVYGDRNKASKGEKRIKNIIVDLDIKAVIGKKRECFMATLDELDSIYKQAVEHSCKLNIKKDGNMEIEKYKIDKEMLDSNNNLFMNSFNDGKLTFEQLKELLSK
jgi:hypothetical protein